MEPDNDALDPKEENPEWTGVYTWQVRNWTTLTGAKIYSPEFEIGGYSWRLLVFPRGHEWPRGSADHISVYLNFAQTFSAPRQKRATAKFELVAVNRTMQGVSIREVATHTFSTLAPTCGFDQFIPIQEALNPYTGCLVANSLTLHVKIDLGIYGLLGMATRLKTGFVGIKSLGRSSLLSSVLQCLFHIKAIRKAVYEILTMESEDARDSSSLALQHLFYKLQYQNASVDANDVAKGLDWNHADDFLQHTASEVLFTIFAMLGEEHKVDSVTNCVSDFLTGECSTYVESPDIQNAPTANQPCRGLVFEVLNCRDIYASIESSFDIDTMEEDNHNLETSHEVGNPKQYEQFDSFPIVLVCDLARYDCNPDRGTILKINSHYEFYDELDLDYNDRALQSKDADRSIENKYKLHSVVAHGGSPTQGRYIAFIRGDDKWYVFDNEVVQEVSADLAITAQFGDQEGTACANFSQGFNPSNKSSAVMLIYIRKSEWERVMCEVGKQHLLEPIKDRFEKERMEKEEQQKPNTGHLFVNIKLAMDFHFTKQIGEKLEFDLANFDDVKDYRLYKEASFEDFKEIVWQDFKIPKDLQRFWLWHEQTNNTVRVSNPLNEEEHDLKTVLDLRPFRDNTSIFDMEQNALMTVKLFLESHEKASLSKIDLRPIQENELLIFLKCYDPNRASSLIWDICSSKRIVTFM